MSALVGFLGGVVATLAVIFASMPPSRRRCGYRPEPSPDGKRPAPPPAWISFERPSVKPKTAQQIRDEADDLLWREHDAVQRWLAATANRRRDALRIALATLRRDA